MTYEMLKENMELGAVSIDLNTKKIVINCNCGCKIFKMKQKVSGVDEAVYFGRDEIVQNFLESRTSFNTNVVNKETFCNCIECGKIYKADDILSK